MYALTALVGLCALLGCQAAREQRRPVAPAYVSTWGHSFFFPGVTPGDHIPLVVFLHGCNQPAWHAWESTQLRAWATQRGFAVLLPEQSRLRNPWKCWNWFAGRDESEMDEVVALVKDYQARYPLLPSQTYVMGLSAGGVLAAHLLACRPKVFHAGAVMSGAAFGMLGWPEQVAPVGPTLASPLAPERLAHKAAACLEESNVARPVSVLVMHGSGDWIARPDNAVQAALQFVGANTLLVDGALDPARAFEPLQVVEVPARAGHKGYTVTRFQTVQGARVELVNVDGMGHAWSGGPNWMPFVDGQGPDATRLALDFFGLRGQGQGKDANR